MKTMSDLNLAPVGEDFQPDVTEPDPVVKYKPAVPVWVRATVYWIGLISSFLSIIVVGVFAVFSPLHAKDVMSTVGIWNTAWLYLSNQLAVAYLPAAPSAP
jgi:hypothetical protein